MASLDPSEGVDAELSWIRLSERGAAQLVQGDAEAARESWRQACDIAGELAMDDPRRAAGLNNLGIGNRLTGDLAQAEHDYQLALQAWDSAAGWVDRMQAGGAARSSLFHMRLENRHRDQYRRNAIVGFRKELGAGHAATINNLAELAQAAERPIDARKLYTEALEQRRRAFQYEEPGARAMKRNIASLSGSRAGDDEPCPVVCAGARPFSEQAQENRWIIDLPPLFTDEGRLMGALLCAFVLDHVAASKVGA